jgi:serine/threonine protein kinase
VVKLGDLGVAKLMKGAMTNTQIGTPHYMPPEVWPLHKREIQCVTPSLQ